MYKKKLRENRELREQETIAIYFSARNLDLNTKSTTGSFIKVFLQETKKSRVEKFKSKDYLNNLNPDYTETLVQAFNLEIRMTVEVQVYQAGETPKYIGKASATIGQIFGTRRHGLSQSILDKHEKQVGTLIMKCEKLDYGNKFIQFQISASDLSIDSSLCSLCPWWFPPTKFFCRLYKSNGGTDFTLEESSEVEGPNPNFGALKINLNKLCNNNQDAQVHLQILKWHAFAPTFYGKISFTLRSLTKPINRFPLMSQTGTYNGVVMLQNIKRYQQHQFTDYLLSGMEMALVICIDFTSSNKHPTDPSSLHYTTHNKTSKYEDALKEATTILMDYDDDRLVPTYGFGAEVKMPDFNTRQKASHFFPLNGNMENPNFYQVEGIMKGYRNCMKYLRFSTPTYFSPLLMQAMKECQKMKRERKQYMILLILTDGEIHDEDEVKDLLVKCGKLPLSIIIVGIGQEGDWKIMHRLDDDECQMVDHQGNKTQRDLVQFVQFSKYKNDGVELARQVLFELPRQVEEYHQLVGLTPEAYKKNIETNDAFRQRAQH